MHTASDDPARFPIENPNPVFRAAADGVLLFANRASDDLLASWHTNVGGTLPAEWRERVVHALTSGDGQRVPVQCKDRVFELDLVPILSANYVNFYGRDVTEQEAARREREALVAELTQERARLRALTEELSQREAALRVAAETLERRVQERTAELEAIFASLPAAVYVGDENGIVRCNQAALDSCGCDGVEELHESAAVLAEKMQARYADTGRPIPPEDLVMARALRGESIAHEVISRHLKTQRDIIHRSVAAPIVLEGKIIGAVGVATDITEQKRVQAQIAYQASLLENVSDAVFAYDTDLRITAWNHAAEEQYGWRAEEVLGANVVQVIGSQVPDEERAAVLHRLPEAGRWHGEVRHARRDGAPIVVEVTALALRDTSGEVFAYVTVSHDITERKRAESQREALHEELRQNRERLQSLSHRLVELQEKERYDVANQLYNDEGQRLSAVLLGLGGLQRSEQCDPSLAPQIGALKELVDGVLQDMHSLAVSLRPAGLDRLGLGAALAQLVFQFGRDLGVATQIEVSALGGLHLRSKTETGIFRIVQDALSNVARHSKAHNISLTAAQQGGHLTIVIEDDGVGFDVNEAHRRGALGLLGMQERAEALGGRLSVESTPGRGTTVFVQVPE